MYIGFWSTTITKIHFHEEEKDEYKEIRKFKVFRIIINLMMGINFLPTLQRFFLKYNLPIPPPKKKIGGFYDCRGNQPPPH